MKNILNKLSFMLLLGGAWGCSSVLEEAPKAVAVSNFYNTADEMQTAVNAIYQQLRNLNNISGTLGAQVEAYTDYMFGRGSYLFVNQFQGLNSTNISRTDEGWRLLYLGIRNANIVIKQAPLGKNINKDNVTQAVAEAKFLRAYQYFWLVRNWGAVPLRTEATLDQPNLPRASVENVYKLILADLQEAETNLPATPAQAGRATTWAAKAALAEVYLTLGQFANARDKLSQIMASNKFSLVPVTIASDFNNLFGPTVVTTAENVWSLQNTRQAGQGMYWAMFMATPSAKTHGAGGFTGFYTDSQTNTVFKTWDDKDLRKSFGWFKWDIAAGPNTYMNRKFPDPLAPAADAAGNQFPIYRYADILLWFAEMDSRANNGPTAAAVEALNQVHRRAYGYPATGASPVDFKASDYTADTFVDLVVKERGYETQVECKRWLDLKRLGVTKLRQIIKTNTGLDVQDKHLFWPIPVGEINFNTALDATKDQNPGY